jgi:adenylate cyclase
VRAVGIGIRKPGTTLAHLRDLIGFERTRGIQLPAWLDRVVSLGIVSEDPDVVRRQKVANLVSYAAAINAVARVISYFFFDFADFWFAFGFGTTLAIWALIIHRLHRFGDNVAATALIAWYITGILFTTFMFGLQTQAQVFFVLSGVMLFLFGVENWRLFLFWFAIVVVVMLIVLNYAPAQGAVTDPRLLHSMSMQSMLTAVSINAIVIFYALFVLRRTELDLRRARERTDALLGVVLPDRIARRLRAQPEKRIADRMDGVSLLFADLAGFTPVAHEEGPEQVVAYLDEFVRAFDLMCETYGVEKIKTIGDAYMAAGGLSGDTRSGAIAIGMLALEMMKAQARRPTLAGRRLTLRVGIHYGTVIAGVIGDTRISYDVWGDAVNIASRMQSQGVPGRIQASEEFCAAVGDEFLFEDRGTTDLRGIGATHTFFLVGMSKPA